MDAYLFNYMHLTEETVVPFVAKTIENLFDSGAKILTLLWHDNSVMMKGGRAYEQLIKKLTAKSDTTFLKGIEAYQLINKPKRLIGGIKNGKHFGYRFRWNRRHKLYSSAKAQQRNSKTRNISSSAPTTTLTS